MPSSYSATCRCRCHCLQEDCGSICGGPAESRITFHVSISADISGTPFRRNIFQLFRSMCLSPYLIYLRFLTLIAPLALNGVLTARAPLGWMDISNTRIRRRRGSDGPVELSR